MVCDGCGEIGGRLVFQVPAQLAGHVGHGLLVAVHLFDALKGLAEFVIVVIEEFAAETEFVVKSKRLAQFASLATAQHLVHAQVRLGLGLLCFPGLFRLSLRLGFGISFRLTDLLHNLRIGLPGHQGLFLRGFRLSNELFYGSYCGNFFIIGVKNRFDKFGKDGGLLIHFVVSHTVCLAGISGSSIRGIINENICGEAIKFGTITGKEVTGNLILPFCQDQAYAFHFDAELGKPFHLRHIVFFHFI